MVTKIHMGEKKALLLVFVVLLLAIGASYTISVGARNKLRRDAIVFCQLRNDAVRSQNVIANNFRNFILSDARRLEEHQPSTGRTNKNNNARYAKYYRKYASRVHPAKLVDCLTVLEK